MPTWAAEKGVAKAIEASCRTFSKVFVADEPSLPCRSQKGLHIWHFMRMPLCMSCCSLMATLMSLVCRIGSCAPASSSTCNGIADVHAAACSLVKLMTCCDILTPAQECN